MKGSNKKMKKFKNLTEYDIINAAYFYYLNLWAETQDDLERCEKILGCESVLYRNRLNEYSKKLEELRSELLRIEHKTSNFA